MFARLTTSTVATSSPTAREARPSSPFLCTDLTNPPCA
nr:MAG TPA: hypothetical protein [Herelleviridae sp.]